MAESDRPSAEDAEDPDAALLRRLQGWFRKDRDHFADWRKQAEEDFDFVAGDQWDDRDKQFLTDNNRPVITFNRVDPLIRSVSGEQINNGQEIRFIPREMGDVKANEVLTSAAEWFRDQCDADDEDSDAFWDAAICGYGWTDSRLDLDSDPDEPMPAVERVDPLEMIPDSEARKRGLSDSKRLFRVRQMTLDAARSLLPGVADEDFDAGWARLDAAGQPHDQDRANEYASEGKTPKDDDDLVTIVQCQWWDREPYYKIALPQGMLSEEQPDSGTKELSVEEYDRIAPRLEALDLPVNAVRLEKRVFKQAFIGRKILKQGPTPCPTHFSFNCITGFRDRNKGTFYGIVRAMKDPQRWANKWLSQTLHIMNSTAKGGVMAERGAVEDQRKFEESWAKSDTVSWFNNGALGNGQVQAKPGTQFPAGFYQLMTFAISSVRDVAGINLEMLGMREADQPASLEYQRRQAGTQILAPLFRSLRRYHRNQGVVWLYYIQHYLSDGRLVKIVGKDGAKYVPLMKQADAKYDVIVDEGPTSPNQKERVWALIGPNFWNLPPEIQIALLDYSPFPESVVAKVKEAAQQAQSGPQAEMAQKMAQLEAGLKQVEMQLRQAQAQKASAEAQQIAVETMRGDAGQGDAQAEHMMAMQRLNAETGLKRESMRQDAALQVRQQNIDASMTQRKAALDARTKVQTAALGAMLRPKPSPVSTTSGTA